MTDNVLERASGKKHPKGSKGEHGKLYFPEQLTLVTDESHYLYDPRVHYPPNNATVETIMEFGVKKNVNTTRADDPGGDPDKCVLEVIDGRQTVINALEANRRLVAEGRSPIRIPVSITTDTESNLARLTVITNEHRREDDPVTKGFKAKRMIENGVPVARLMIDFNVTSEQSIRNWVKLQDLHPSIQELVREGKMTMRRALKLASLKPSEQLKAVKSPKVKEKSKGVDRRRIQRLHESGNYTKNETVAKVIGWIVGEVKDSEIKDIIDISAITAPAGGKKKAAKKKAAVPKKKAAKKKAAAEPKKVVIPSKDA